MTEQSLAPAGVVVMIAFFVLLGILSARSRRRIADAWSGFAAGHGLDHDDGTRHVHGSIDGGRTFVMYQDFARNALGQKRRSQSKYLPEFEIRVGLSCDAPERMVIQKKGMLGGSSSIVTGDAEFDRKAVVACPDPAAATIWLRSGERRKAVLEAVTDLKAVVMGPIPDANTHDGQPVERPLLFRRWDGYKPRRDWFEARFDEFTRLARRIDDA